MQVVVVPSIIKGIERAKEELYQRVDNKTVLFLSGGKTPRPLYETLTKEKIIKPAAVALIDERYGVPMHKKSNEKMIAETGFLEYLSSKKIPFYGILKNKKNSVKTKKTGEGNREKISKDYDETVRNLFFHFPKSLGILGIGSDGHTAGIPSQNSKNKNQNSIIYNTNDFVLSYKDNRPEYLERITLTFAGLYLLDFIIMLVFGKDKKEVLKKIFIPGSLEEIPARFYQKSDIAKKTLFITDQSI